MFIRTEASAGNIFFELMIDGFNGSYLVYDRRDIDGTGQEFDCDTSTGWETMRYSYADAARYFNSFVTESEAIPLF